jgi:hypothetical protein
MEAKLKKITSISKKFNPEFFDIILRLFRSIFKYLVR